MEKFHRWTKFRVLFLKFYNEHTASCSLQRKYALRDFFLHREYLFSPDEKENLFVTSFSFHRNWLWSAFIFYTNKKYRKIVMESRRGRFVSYTIPLLSLISINPTDLFHTEIYQYRNRCEIIERSNIVPM